MMATKQIQEEIASKLIKINAFKKILIYTSFNIALTYY